MTVNPEKPVAPPPGDTSRLDFISLLSVVREFGRTGAWTRAVPWEAVLGSAASLWLLLGASQHHRSLRVPVAGALVQHVEHRHSSSHRNCLQVPANCDLFLQGWVTGAMFFPGTQNPTME